MTIASDVSMNEVEPGAIDELSVLQTFGWIELPMRSRGVVIENLCDGPQHVVVVVEDVVVVPARPIVAFHKDRRRPVDHDLENIVVVEQLLEWPVAGDVTYRSFGQHSGVRDVERNEALLKPHVPCGYLVVHQ